MLDEQSVYLDIQFSQFVLSTLCLVDLAGLMVHRQKLTPVFFRHAGHSRAVNKVPSLRKHIPIKSWFLGSVQPLG